MAGSLPSPSSLSPSLLFLLHRHFKNREDLYIVPLPLTRRLDDDCSDLRRRLLHLNNELSSAASEWISRSRHIDAMIHPPPSPLRSPDGEVRDMIDVELPQLVKEIERIDTVRLYAETTLKLEAAVGDLEDATLSIMSRATQNKFTAILSKSSSTTDGAQKQEKLLHAIDAMKRIEEILVDVAKSRPHCTRLLMAVDSRVEKALAILRPQALSDHRVLLSSLGWPPSLLTKNIEKERCLEILNPLVLMQGEMKEKYSQSFLVLCTLQHLQTQRATRQHKLLRYWEGNESSDLTDMHAQSSLSHGMWVIDELVCPIAARMEYHFSRWSCKPEFIFALVYKTTRDFLDGVDNILQPLVDKAMLVGCSAKEAWVSAMVNKLTKYLETDVFPPLVGRYEGCDGNSEVFSRWLHYIDLMITYDTRMRTLATSGTPIKGLFSQFEGLPQLLSLLSVFEEHPNWLEIWAKIELKDAQDKLETELDLETSWLIGSKLQNDLVDAKDNESFLLSSRFDCKAPPVADSVVRISWAMIERGLLLPSKQIRIQFIKSSATLFLNHFFIILLQRCRDMDMAPAVLDDDELLRVICSINTARYCEYVLQQWADDVSFLEMSLTDDKVQHASRSFFEDEITFLARLETETLVEIVSAVLIQFDALCWQYIQNIGQLGEEQIESEDLSISPAFIYALEMLRERIDIFRLHLNAHDFVDLWRSIADGLDHFIFSSISASSVKFLATGARQLKVDMEALFRIFSPFCARPEAFFPFISDSLKLLALDSEDVNLLVKTCSKGARSVEHLRARGVFRLSAGQAEKILRKMMLDYR